MFDSLGLQLALWLFAAIGSVVAFLRYKQLREQIREKEARLPDACDYIDLTARLATTRAELADTSMRVDEARALIESGARATAEEQAARKWLAEKKEELLQVAAQAAEQQRLKQELDARQAQLSEVESTRRGLLESNERMAQENRGMEARLTEAKRELESIAAVRAEREKQIATIGASIRKAEDDLRKLNREVEDFLDRAGKAEKEADALDARCAAARQQLEALQREIAGKRDEARAQVEAIQKEIAVHRAELERLTATRKAFEEHIAMLKQMIERTERRLDQQMEISGAARSDRYRDLWEPLPFPALPATSGIANEAECLARVEQHLKGIGLHFPPRVLCAFHTALKVAEFSPMVVLAGISGTGKSELPRRYADAMGLHFVGIAVQPRWDSPQDLFGFFNYMEGRYKATELARAMVQFERFNRRRWPLPKDWGGARDDRMLLVLLDEMNLARVEYYFSEFLSKLEVRRGIREDDDKERAKAEIAIDMGSLGKDEHPIMFYPGRNVLFAGTMNEDETTQSLSDKVLDRACVLRFGRPKQASQMRSAGNGTPARNGLTFESWNSWLRREPSPSDAKLVGDWVSALNEAMEKIGRPFGHRVAQAMQAYVANYPEIGVRSADRVRVAFADQIEQRILPKLRGLELDDVRAPMASIRKVLQDCGDRDLLRAFDDGEKNQQIFIWRGLDRTE